MVSYVKQKCQRELLKQSFPRSHVNKYEQKNQTSPEFSSVFALCNDQTQLTPAKKKKAKTHGNKNLVVLAVIRQDKVASQFVMCFNNFRTIDPILKSVCSTKSSLYYLSHFKPFPVFTPWMKWRKIYTFPLDQRIFIAELSKDHVAQRWEHLSATNVAQFRFRFHRLLFVLVFAARLFSGYSGFFLLFKNHHFQIWIRSGKCPHLYSVLNTIAA